MEDPGIKLFGKKIVLPEISKSINLPVISTDAGDNKHGGSDQKSEPEATNPQPQTLKKPDKIIRCPRCASMDTKFCYYNNYNVNQPRHFCKSCQRYWTAGGAMRNMPVGAGRRKNKNLNSHWPYSPSNSPMPIPAIFSPIPIQPSTYWSCIPFLRPSTPAKTVNFDPGEPILGKHLRDDVLMKSNDCEDDVKRPKKSILIPKTLRIDDPDEAAKSSIWATIGIKNENFKAFQEKGEEKKKQPVMRSSPVLQANPAAFSRSLSFQETV